MHQAMQLLYRNHRQSLAKARNIENLQSRPAYKEVYNQERRGFFMEKQIQPKGYSLELKKKNTKKGVEITSPRPKLPISIKLSKEQELLMKKWDKDFKQKQKTIQHLPVLSKNQNNKEVTKGAIRTTAQSSFFEDQSSLNDHDRRDTQQKNYSNKKEGSKSIEPSNSIQYPLVIKKKKKPTEAQKILQIGKISGNLSQIIQKYINNYLATKQQIFQPLLDFKNMIDQMIKNQNYIPNTQKIGKNLLSIAKGLAQTSIRNDMLKFLTLATMEDHPLPNIFFLDFELRRLVFHENQYRLKHVDQSHVKMVVRIFLLVKIFCFRVFNQPWQIEMLQLSKNFPRNVESKIKAVLNYYSSFFYTYATDSKKYLDLQGSGPGIVSKLKQEGFYPMEIKQQQEWKSVYFRAELREENMSLLLEIQGYLCTWVKRITSIVLTNRLKLKDELIMDME